MKKLSILLFVALTATTSCWSMEKLESTAQTGVSKYESVKREVSELETLIINEYIKAYEPYKKNRIAKFDEYKKTEDEKKDTWTYETWEIYEAVHDVGLNDYHILYALRNPEVETNKRTLLQRWMYSGENMGFVMPEHSFLEANFKLIESLKEKTQELEELNIVTEALTKIKDKELDLTQIKELAKEIATAKTTIAELKMSAQYPVSHEWEKQLEQKLNDLIEQINKQK